MKYELVNEMIKDGRLSFKTQSKIEFLPLDNDSKKCFEKSLPLMLFRKPCDLEKNFWKSNFWESQFCSIVVIFKGYLHFQSIFCQKVALHV